MHTTEFHSQFFTATILEWKKLLQPDKYKTIVTESLSFLVKDNRVIVNAFVIMDNHLHILWQAINGHTPQQTQHSFLKYAAQKIKFDLEKHHPDVLKHFKVDAADRTYQIWERNPLSINLFTEEVFFQKLDYLHYNPVEAGLCSNTEDYHFSSAKFYEKGIDEFGFLSHWRQ